MESTMRVQASVLLTFQAKTLTDAGAVLDDVLERAREREDTDVAAVELTRPAWHRPVTLPLVTGAGPRCTGRAVRERCRQRGAERMTRGY
jgi:hypothetical protein